MPSWFQLTNFRKYTPQFVSTGTRVKVWLTFIALWCKWKNMSPWAVWGIDWINPMVNCVFLSLPVCKSEWTSTHTNLGTVIWAWWFPSHLTRRPKGVWRVTYWPARVIEMRGEGEWGSATRSPFTCRMEDRTKKVKVKKAADWNSFSGGLIL